MTLTMRISRLFIDQSLDVHTTVSVDIKKSHYLTQVLRLKKGQSIILFNGLSEHDYSAQIHSIGKTVTLSIEKKLPTNKESTLKTTLFQALSKNEHMDFMIQKCTELGINSIIIFNSERTQIPLKAQKYDKKQLHWQRIAQSACEQCGRSIVPNIEFFPKLADALSLVSSNTRIMLDFNGMPITHIINTQTKHNVDILLGAEGGLSPPEIQTAEHCFFKKVRLGPRILRTETAATTALSLIQMLTGDLN